MSEETPKISLYHALSDAETIAALRTLYRVPSQGDLITTLHERFREARGMAFIDTSFAWRRVQECLATEDPLLAFAAWYSTWINGNMAFAQMFGVESTKLGMGMTLFAIKPFRVQLFLFDSGSTIPNHRHPDVESYEVYVAGDMELTKDNVPQTIRDFVTENEHGICASNGGMIRIPANSVHGGYISKLHGGAFMSIQYWLNNWEDESVASNWTGEDGSTNG